MARKPPILTVSEVTAHIRRRLESDAGLALVWVRGETSNCRLHSSGHLYFTLKDAGASLKCVMFRSRAVGLAFQPGDGLAVLARGRVGVYDRGGSYQLYVEEMVPQGVGSLFLAYEQLKQRLAAEGLFAEERKRSLPLLPRAVGVVTSPTGAAIRDILTVAQRRFPGVKLFIAPVLVQGEAAAADVARGLQLVARTPGVDVIILARGGGSFEELMPFNSETVARAVYQAPVPVVTAVGHETDFTIADLVADVRAPTPSAGAELVVPARNELLRHLTAVSDRGQARVAERLGQMRQQIALVGGAAALVRAPDRIDRLRQQVDDLWRQAVPGAARRLQTARGGLERLAAQLEGLSPLAILARGYLLARKLPGRELIRSTANIGRGDRLRLVMVDGEVDCRVEDVCRKEAALDERERS